MISRVFILFIFSWKNVGTEDSSLYSCNLSNKHWPNTCYLALTNTTTEYWDIWCLFSSVSSSHSESQLNKKFRQTQQFFHLVFVFWRSNVAFAILISFPKKKKVGKSIGVLMLTVLKSIVFTSASKTSVWLLFRTLIWDTKRCLGGVEKWRVISTQISWKNQGCLLYPDIAVKRGRIVSPH